MRLFAGIWKKKAVDTVPVKCLDREVLKRALHYAEHLVLPEPSGKAVAYLTEQKVKRASEKLENEKRYCIRFLSDGTKAGDLNAGYLAGQISAFLRFQGNAGIRIHKIEEKEKKKITDAAKPDTPWKMHCRAVLASGEHEHTGRRRKRMISEIEPGIYTEKRENWNEELLAYTRKQYPGTFRKLNSTYKDGWIHFSEKRPAGIHLLADAFEAGLAAAQIMAAAEMLWVELELSKNTACSDADYLFSVRRKAYNDTEKLTDIAEQTERTICEAQEKESGKGYQGNALAGFGAGVAAVIS